MEKKHLHYLDFFDLRGDGAIVVYKRSDHKRPRYVARLKVPHLKGYITKSTKTFDRNDAVQFAKQLYYETEGKVERGEAVTTKKFTKVFQAWASHRRVHESHLAYTNGDIRSAEIHILPYFKDEKIDAVDNAAVTEFLSHRITNTDQKPSDSTLKQEVRRLKSILQFALDAGDISRLPKIKTPKAKPNARPAFTDKEWDKLTTAMQRREVASKGNAAHLRDRFYLRHYVLILGNSGIRTGEAQQLTWADVSFVKTDDKKLVIFAVSGKTGARGVVCNDWATRVIERLKERRTKETGSEPEGDEPLFCHPNGKPIKSFKRSFRSLLDDTGLTKDRQGKKRVLYSIRHTYATMRLKNGVSIYQLAANMGTSVDMIERYYGKATNTSATAAKELTKGAIPLKK